MQRMNSGFIQCPFPPFGKIATFLAVLEAAVTWQTWGSKRVRAEGLQI